MGCIARLAESARVATLVTLQSSSLHGEISMYRSIGKRVFDFTAAFGLIVVLSPLFAVVALLVRMHLGSPVFFMQERPGLKGRLFRIIKFRTMTDGRDERGELLPDGGRLTQFGRFLRSSSLDEFPELINVIRGEMSLVGPRPLRVEYLTRYSSDQARRHHVKPGITGWAQINGRNAISWEDRFRLDVWYVDNVSFWLDLKILWLTTWRVLGRVGISAEGEATMPEFMGKAGEGERRR